MTCPDLHAPVVGMSSSQGLETPRLPVLAGSWAQDGGDLVTEEGQGDSTSAAQRQCVLWLS